MWNRYELHSLTIYIKGTTKHAKPGVSNLLASLVHTGGRRVVLGHTLNTLGHVTAKKYHNVLSKVTIFCWAAVIAISGRMQPVSHRLDTPGRHENYESNAP